MQVEFAFAASSAAGVAPRDAWNSHGAETGMDATSINLGMQLAFACTGVVVPVRRVITVGLVRETAQCTRGAEVGVMTFDAFAMAGRKARRESVSAKMTRS
jgi:hypothetical protein